MRRILFLMIVAVSVSSVTSYADQAKEHAAIIGSIRNRYAVINDGVNSYRRVVRDMQGDSAEGGSLEGFYKGDSLRKIIATYYGETGKLIEEYYLWDGELFFVYTRDIRYDKPLSGKVLRTDENRYYFNGGEMIRWLDPRKKEIPQNAVFKEKERTFLEEAQKLSEKLKGD